MKNKRGFTLAELSVSLALLAIVSTMIVSFSVLISQNVKKVTYQQTLITEINLADSLFRAGKSAEEINQTVEDGWLTCSEITSEEVGEYTYQTASLTYRNFGGTEESIVLIRESTGTQE